MKISSIALIRQDGLLRYGVVIERRVSETAQGETTSFIVRVRHGNDLVVPEDDALEITPWNNSQECAFAHKSADFIAAQIVRDTGLTLTATPEPAPACDIPFEVPVPDPLAVLGSPPAPRVPTNPDDIF